MYSAFNNIKVEIFGESHAPEIGVRLSGIPKGIKIDEDKIQILVDRRKASQNPWSTRRNEDDNVEILSGLDNGYTDGSEIYARILNTDIRSKDYESIRNIPRPSHADYSAHLKNNSPVPIPGSGRYSGRMTAALCIAGSIAKQILEQEGISIYAYVSSIAGIKAKGYIDGDISKDNLEKARSYSICNIESQDKADIWTKAILLEKEDGNSVGGIVECVVLNMKKGVGDALFEGLEGRIAQSVYAIPAVKGVEFGAGFDIANKLGSEANDQFTVKDGEVSLLSNNAGGINGGISNGAPILLRAAFRPTPSISKTQQSVNIETKEIKQINIEGRHDACIVPRAVPVVESAVALAILDAILDK
ncbi:MAG: chorismate synthase [Clostridia bacterium]|nr:chorismate synthase [Clostridia bacterium]